MCRPANLQNMQIWRLNLVPRAFPLAGKALGTRLLETLKESPEKPGDWDLRPGDFQNMC